MKHYRTAEAAASAILLLACAFTASAQSRAETRQYQKAIKAATIEAYSAFIAKYPESQYSVQLRGKLDTALNVTPLTAREASSILAGLRSELDPKSEGALPLHSVGLRKEGIDYAIGMQTESPLTGKIDSIYFYITRKVGDIWQIPEVRSIAKETMSAGITGSEHMAGPEIVTLGTDRYVHYAYTNANVDDESCEWVETLIDVSNQNFRSAIFYGRPLRGHRIEGQCNLSLSEDMADEATRYLLGRIASNERLTTISEANAQSDQAIRWWIENNPDALTNATSLRFASLPDSCSISTRFDAARDKESGAGYKILLMDFRGYTLVCAQKASGEHILVWCEPQCRNRAKDRLLNTIYFEHGANISLFFYHGRKAFKYHLNLTSKKLTR